MRNWLFAALGAVSLFATGVGAASAAPHPGPVMMQDRSPAMHASPYVQRSDYQWHRHHYRHRHWEHNRWRYWN